MCTRTIKVRQEEWKIFLDSTLTFQNNSISFFFSSESSTSVCMSSRSIRGDVFSPRRLLIMATGLNQCTSKGKTLSRKTVNEKTLCFRSSIQFSDLVSLLRYSEYQMSAFWLCRRKFGIKMSRVPYEIVMGICNSIFTGWERIVKKTFIC